MYLCSVLFYLGVVSTPAYSARILGIAPTPSFSHQIAFQSLWSELSLRGQQVTVLTTDPMRNRTLTNLTEIDMSISHVKWNEYNLMSKSVLKGLQLMKSITSIFAEIVDEQFLIPLMQQLFKNETEHFELVMTEAFYPSMAAFSQKFKCPLIQMFSVDAYVDYYEALGNPSHSVLYPFYFLPFGNKLTFLERLISTMTSAGLKHMHRRHILPLHDRIIKKHFVEDNLLSEEIIKSTSLLFVNTDVVFHAIRPLQPNIIQIGGGSHLSAPQLLPKDLQKVLDNSRNGFIYFSLGSNVRSSDLPDVTIQIILDTLAELPYTTLWKFEKDLPRKHDNIIISEWFPQQDIFRHPNIKLFITQGGSQSIEEAVYNEVPMLGIPFVADQHHNVQRLVDRGMALSMDHDKLEKGDFKTAILEMVGNPRYRNRVKELVRLGKDQPMSSLERVVWWTEYVIRHKGITHLRSPAADLPAYQYLLLDIVGLCLTIIAVAVYILAKLN